MKKFKKLIAGFNTGFCFVTSVPKKEILHAILACDKWVCLPHRQSCWWGKVVLVSWRRVVPFAWSPSRDLRTRPGWRTSETLFHPVSWFSCRPREEERRDRLQCTQAARRSESAPPDRLLSKWVRVVRRRPLAGQVVVKSGKVGSLFVPWMTSWKWRCSARRKESPGLKNLEVANYGDWRRRQSAPFEMAKSEAAGGCCGLSSSIGGK